MKLKDQLQSSQIEINKKPVKPHTLSLRVSSETVDGKLLRGISISIVIPPVEEQRDE